MEGLPPELWQIIKKYSIEQTFVVKNGRIRRARVRHMNFTEDVIANSKKGAIMKFTQRMIINRRPYYHLVTDFIWHFLLKKLPIKKYIGYQCHNNRILADIDHDPEKLISEVMEIITTNKAEYLKKFEVDFLVE